MASSLRVANLAHGRALVGMELCERAMEGAELSTRAVLIDVIGHLRVTRARDESSATLVDVYHAVAHSINFIKRFQTTMFLAGKHTQNKFYTLLVIKNFAFKFYLVTITSFVFQG